MRRCSLCSGWGHIFEEYETIEITALAQREQTEAAKVAVTGISYPQPSQCSCNSFSCHLLDIISFWKKGVWKKERITRLESHYLVPQGHLNLLESLNKPLPFQLRKLGSCSKLSAISLRFLPSQSYLCLFKLTKILVFVPLPSKPNSPIPCQRQFVTVCCSYSLSLQARQPFPLQKLVYSGSEKHRKQRHLIFSLL